MGDKSKGSDVGAAVAEAHAADAPAPWHEGAAELAAAEALIHGGRIGLSGKTIRPFTEHLKSAIRRQFPADRDFYDDSDRTQRRVMATYISMRVATLAFFGLFLASLYWLASLFVTGGQATFDGMASAYRLFAVLGAGLVSLVVFWVARRLTRWFVFNQLEHQAASYSHRVMHHLRVTQMQVVAACNQMRNRVANGWAAHAKSWMKIALVRAKRSEYLDRYASTVLWKFETTLPTLEQAFWVAKGLLALGVGAAIWMLSPDARAPAPAGMLACKVGLIALIAVGLWLWLSRRTNAFWTQAFANQGTATPRELHYMEVIPDVVQNLVAEILEHARSPGGTNHG